MATIPVPLTTDVSPWLWYDSADPTMIRNSGSSLTTWYNKGTSGGLSNVTLIGTPTMTTLNGWSTVNTTSANRFTTPAVTATANTYSIFVVTTLTQAASINFIQSAGGIQYNATYNSSTGMQAMTCGVNGQVVTATANFPANLNTPKLYTMTIKSSANYFGIDGSSIALISNGSNVGTLASAGAKSYQVFTGGVNYPASQEGAEILVYMGDITATQRQQIEGYLAWKWGLQANLPTSHPFSVANKAMTMALYNRRHGFTSVFATGMSGLIGVICDAASNVYVAGGTGNYIRKYNSSGVQQWNITSVDGVACNNPSYVSRDLSDNIYVSEVGGRRIIKINPAGAASIFKSGISTDVGPIAVDSSGAVYYFNTASSIMKITADGSSTTTFVTSTSGAFWKGMVCDASNNIFSSDGKVITKITPAGVMSTFAGVAGTAGSTDGIGTDALFNNEGAATMNIDSRGYIYVGEDIFGKKARMISPAGVVLTITGQAGVTTPTAASTDGIDINARYSSCNAVAPAPDGSIYIGDRMAGNIRKINAGTLNQIGTYASVTSTYQSASDEFGNLYVGSYSGNNITKITPSGISSIFIAAGIFNSAPGLVRDEFGNFYVGEHLGNRIRKVTPAGLVTTFVSSISAPLGLTMGPDKNLYASTHSDHTIRQITPTGVVTTYAGASGQGGMVDNVNRLSARFYYPCHLAFDASGIMYIADSNNNRIRKIDLSSNVTTFAGSGAGADSDGIGTSAGVFSPHGIAFDRNGIMYVSEWAGASVRRITPSAVVSTIASGLNNCTYCQIDSGQNLWVSNTLNNSVRYIAINAVPTGSVSITGTLTQGQIITANTSTLEDIDGFGTFSYVWSASPTANGVYTTIVGATGSTLTLSEAQVAKFIRVAVSYTDGRGTAEAVSANAVGAIVNVNDTAVGLDISGTLSPGSTLTAITANIVDPDGNAPPYTYQWASSSSPSSGFSNIGGATGSTYALTLSEVGKYIRLTVGYTNNYGAADSAVATTASVVINPNSPVQGTLGISGDLIEGRTLTANTSNISDADGLGVFSYTWSSSATSNGLFTVDASGTSSMTLVAGQANRYIKLEVRYVDGKGNAEYIASSVVGPVIATTVPSAPTGASATATVLGASLSWSAPSDNGYMPILGYRVFDASSTLVVDTSGLSHSISGLNARQTYTYTVVAYNAKGNSAAATVSVVPLSPPVTAIETGAIPEAVQIPITVAGVEAVVQKITPAVEADGTKTVSFAPEPTKTAVAIANLPAEVEKVVVATAAPQNGYTTLKISAFNSAGSSVSNFAASPLTITLGIPGYTSETVLVRTFQTIGGPVSDSVVATRNSDGTYTMTLTHLTYIRVSQNVPCFVEGTKILTAAGYKAVEEIVDGELVATADGRALPCKLYITEVDATTKENAPYVIPANTFGPRCPARDLTLSPLHAVQLRRGVWQIPKAAATIYAGVRQLPIGRPCTYYHLEMPNYLTDNIVADGTVVESYGARQLKGRRVEYKFDDVVGGFTRTITEARRAPVKRA